MASSSEKSGCEANILGKRKPEDVLETKPILRKHKEEKETTKSYADTLRQIDLLVASLISVKEAAIRKKTIFVSNLSPQTKITDIIRFFKKDGEVVRVRLKLNKLTEYVGTGFVEFASPQQARKALKKNIGEYLHGHKIFLDRVKIYPPPLQFKYCVEHKVCYEDRRPENFLIEEDEAVQGLDQTPDFVEEVLFVANLSPQTKMIHIISLFKHVVEVVNVRLIVNHEGKHVGYGFVEFASAYEAKKALEKKNGEYLHDHKIFLTVAKKAPYPPRSKYNLAEMLCYEDYLRRKSLLVEEDETVEGVDESPDFVEEVAIIREKTLFVDNLSGQTEISHIINFFKDVGEVVHVRFIVDNKGKHVGYGFVEFASATEAKKALEKKNGEYLHDKKISLANKFPYPLRSKYCIDYKVWYEDYIRRECLWKEEDGAVKGLDETPAGFVEDVAVREKTLFVYNLSYEVEISHILRFFKYVGEVVGIRLIVNELGDLVGSGFVEFASADQAKKALQIGDRQNLRCRKVYLDVIETAPYTLRPKYNRRKNLRSEDYLPQESLEEDDLETKSLEEDDLKTKSLEEDDLETKSLEEDDLETKSLEEDDLETKSLEEDDLETNSLEEDDLENKPNLKVPIFRGKKITFSDDS